jgi:hypothetical protein
MKPEAAAWAAGFGWYKYSNYYYYFKQFYHNFFAFFTRLNVCLQSLYLFVHNKRRLRPTTNDDHNWWLQQTTMRCNKMDWRKTATNDGCNGSEGFDDGYDEWERQRRSKTRQKTCLGPLVCSFDFFNILTNVLYHIQALSMVWTHEEGYRRPQRSKRAQMTPHTSFGPLVRLFLILA